MDPREFQRLAVQLAASASAAERRTSVSRCYYAVFNVAAEHLRSLKFPVGKGAAAHGEVRLCLINSGVFDLMDAGATLQVLHTARIRADYQMERQDAESGSTASANVATATRLIALLDQSFAGASRSKIQASITQWRRANGYP
ncbi:MAG TPA: hypothetical protein VIM11_25360 [Tepidisphaeraceae bacterium]|jgi:hypothetical protein